MSAAVGSRATGRVKQESGMLLEARGLVKRYPTGRLALDHVDLDASGGEIIALLGPNGAGKTTLAGIITTRVRPSAGSLRVVGIDVSRNPAAVKRRVGTVTQHNTLDRSLRVGDVLYWHCRYFNQSRRDSRARAQELLERFELAERRDERIAALSGGLARRLQLAAAIAHRPALIVLDEPTTELDAGSRQALWEQVRELAHAGACVLLTTHYLEEADALSTRLLVLDQGRLIAEGAPDQLRDRVGADTLLEALLAHPDQVDTERLRAIAGVTHVSREAARLLIFARHRDGLIADASTPLLAAGLRDLAITKPRLDQVIAALTQTHTRDHETRRP